MSVPKQLFDRFTEEVARFLKDGGASEVLDDDLQFGMELQRERLKNREMELDYTFTPRGHFSEGGHGRVWSDGKYRCSMDWRSCSWNRTLIRKGKQFFRDKDDKVLYVTVNDLVKGSASAQAEPYRCPNCGNLTTVGEISHGCPYCGTHFEMEDLFPRVSSYYFVKDFGGTEKEVYGEIKKYMLPSAAVFGGFGLISGILGRNRESIVLGILGTIFMTVFSAGAGAVMGYMIWAFRKLGTLFGEAGKSIGLLFQMGGSRKRFETAMQRFSPEFSYEYFVNKAASLARMIIFCEDPAALPVYTGEQKENPFSNVLDAQFRGPAALRSFRTEGDYVAVRTTVFFEMVREVGGIPVKQNRAVTMDLRKNVMLPFRQGYSIRKVSCANCGGSFDATRRTTCPYCGSPYRIQDDDWYVTDFRMG